jgi:hypothetical protein
MPSQSRGATPGVKRAPRIILEAEFSDDMANIQSWGSLGAGTDV